MNFRDFLPLAETLAQSDGEAAWRTSVSRAYYTAFHVACNFMTSLGFAVPKTDRAHGYLWLRLDNAGHAEVLRRGHMLKDLRSRRNIADYDQQRKVTRPHAEKALLDARDIIGSLDALTKTELPQI